MTLPKGFYIGDNNTIERYKRFKETFRLNARHYLDTNIILDFLPTDNILKQQIKNKICILCEKNVDHNTKTGCGHYVLCHDCANDESLTDTELNMLIEKARDLGAYKKNYFGELLVKIGLAKQK